MVCLDRGSWRTLFSSDSVVGYVSDGCMLWACCMVVTEVLFVVIFVVGAMTVCNVQGGAIKTGPPSQCKYSEIP